MDNYIAFVCIKCGNIEVHENGKDGLSCVKCNGYLDPTGHATRDEYLEYKNESAAKKLEEDIERTSKKLDGVIKKAEYLLELLERIEQQSKNWNEHVLSQYMGLKM